MVTIHRIGRLKICVYADHAPPHFHVRAPGVEARIDLASLREIESTLPRRELVKAIEWAMANRNLIEAEWNELNERED